ncbi:MAG: hypothetical protein U1A27_08350 [Phycisphaerae bacterium]
MRDDRQRSSRARSRAGAALARALALGLMSAGGCGKPATQVVEVERSALVVIRQPTQTRIEGLSALAGWGAGRDCTFMHCLEVTLNGLGRHVDYDELMGLSGLAFRTQFRPGAWDASCPEPFAGAECVSAALSALGLEAQTFFPQRGGVAGESVAARDAVHKSLDAGVPVLATNLIPPENWGIVTGYSAGGKRWWCRTYESRESDAAATGWPTAIFIVLRRTGRPEPRAAHRASVARAVSLHGLSETSGFAQGRGAFEAWAAELEKASGREYMQANAWTYVSLVDARGAAARYLRRIAPEFGLARGAVLRAADLFERERQQLENGRAFVPWPRDVPGGEPPEAVRSRQRVALREAALLEEQAFAELRKAQ